MADETRDLELRVSANAEQAKAELGATTAAEAEVAAEAERASIIAQRAADSQAAALSEVTSASNAAGNAVSNMAELSAAGGKKYAVSITEARDAVARLEIAIEAVRARGGPVSPAAIAELALFDAAVQAAAASMEKAAGSTKTMSAEVGLARGNIGGMANAMRGLGGTIGNTVLGFLVFEGLFKLLPTLIKSVEDAGTGLGNMYSKLTGGVVENTAAEDKAAVAVAKHDAAMKASADASELMVRAQSALASGVIVSTDNVKTLEIEFLAYMNRLRGATDVSEEYRKLMHSIGITVPESLSKIRGEVNAFGEEYRRQLEVNGPKAAKTFADAHVAQVDRWEQAFIGAGKTVPKALLDITAAMSKMTAEGKRLETEFNLTQHFNDLNEALAHGAGEFGSMKLAVQALEPELASLKKSLEAEIKAHGDADGAMLKELLTIRQWELDAGIHIATRDKLKKAIEDLGQKYAKEADQIDDLSKKHAAATVAIETHRQAAIKAGDDMLAKVVASTAGEIKSLTERWRAGEIGNSEYRDKIAQIQMDEVNARRKAQEDEAKVNEDAATSLDTLTKDYDKKGEELSQMMRTQQADIKDLKEARAALTKENAAGITALDDEAKAHERVITVIKPSKQLHDDMKQALTDTTAHIKADHVPALDAVHGAHTGKLHVSVPKTTGLLGDLRLELLKLPENAPAIVASLDSIAQAMDRVATSATNADTATTAFTGDAGGGGAGAA
ncbi:MAG: hypothetical protein M3167_06310 [Acidobacteriota bacterium]|nr:hypothetical protein [Acidobacteriota bacterium]MDQ6892277.1 hypothetical protein [Acidobacteriota bacterium]